MKKYQRLNKIALKRLFRPSGAKIMALLGARQVGKTTLLEDFAKDWKGKTIFFTGDKLEDALLWRGEFSKVKEQLEIGLGSTLENISLPALIIFDEIQKIPEAFNNLKLLYDNFREKVRIAISGSSSLLLLNKTSESLGGRVEIITMYPLSLAEIFETKESVWMANSLLDFNAIKEKTIQNSAKETEAEKILSKAIVFGLFPEVFLQEEVREAKILHQNYHQTYIEKDVRNLKEIGNILDFDLVWKIAHRSNGKLINYSNISKETGLAFNTVKKYIAILSASYNLELLPPYSHGIRKRIVKSPKIFSVDIGFFNFCLNLYDKNELISSRFIGEIFESLMLMEFLKQERAFIMGGEPFFFRTSTGAEVDLLIERGEELFAYEFKYSQKVGTSDFNSIKSLMSATSNVKRGFVISRQPYPEQFGENLFAIPWWMLCS